jgi:nitrile hydratase
MHGFGPIEREEHEPPFHAAWEAHVRALNSLSQAGGLFNSDAMRYGIERMAPAAYLHTSYYGRWLASLEYNLLKQGLVSADELEARVAFLRDHPEAAPPPVARPDVPPRAQQTRPREPAEVTPRFAVGDAVVTRNVHPTGHTRLPRYARGKRGVIHLVHGSQFFPDTNAHGLGEQPQTVYNVRFDGSELWGESAGRPELVHIDLWESYLEPAPS